MQHAVGPVAAHAIEPSTYGIEQPALALATVQDNTSQSSTSSPRSQKLLPELNTSQVSESTLPSVATRELTPPSSVASSLEQPEFNRQSTQQVLADQPSVPSTSTSRKRTANGQLKETVGTDNDAAPNTTRTHGRNESIASVTSLGDLSQQLRTKLTYAMIKVQNGWQKHSLDEIESIASQSPRSNLAGFASREYQSLVSPRTALAAGMRQNSDTSSSSDQAPHQQPTLATMCAPQPSTHLRKALAPPAPILSGNRRRPTPNVNLHINSSLNHTSRSARPTPTQRTPSQNAAMEADAVETLLFMSASPSNSGHFPSHLSAYSPTSQVFSTQTSPLKAHFSAADQGFPTSGIEYSPPQSHRRLRYEDKAALIDRLLHDLDDDESEELDRAVKIMDQHHAAKLSA